MTRTARQPHEWLTLGVGLVAALTWALLGVRSITDNDPSIKALFACAALALVGFALGPVIWILAAPKRAKRPPADAAALAEMNAPTFAMSGIMMIGMGASSIMDPSPSVWGWAMMVAASLVGGLNLGVAFMSSPDQAAPSDAPRHSTGAPQSGG